MLIFPLLLRTSQLYLLYLYCYIIQVAENVIVPISFYQHIQQLENLK